MYYRAARCTFLSSFIALVEPMTSQIEQLEHSIQSSKKLVDLGNALERLLQNRDFKSIMLEGYLEHEAIRLVHLKADPAMQTPAHQQSILCQIDAIGAVSAYLNEVRRQANLATKAIIEADEVLDELRASGEAE